jgi:restriction system protein
MGDAVARGLVGTLALFGQIILPFLFGIAALISGFNSIRGKKLYDKIESRSGVASLNEMSWEDFERLVGEYYRRNGFQVTREGGNGPDGGMDLVLRKDGETHLVQCKQWRSYKVGVQPVREFYGVMAARGVAGGFFVSSGVYTEEAQKFVRGLNLELVDGSKLREMIDSARKKPAVSGIKNESQKAILSTVCPKCGAEMVKRIARQGVNAGKEFWGCSTFPKCNGNLPYDDNAGDWAVLPTTIAAVAPVPGKKSCPHCGEELVIRQYKSGIKTGQYFYGCVPCKKGWPVVQAASSNE